MAKKRFSHTITYLLLLLIFLGVSLVRDLDPKAEPVKADVLGGNNLVKVMEVVDGDTIGVQMGAEVVKVRLIGIDTPETKRPGTPIECFGREASSHMQSLLLGKMVRLEGDPTQSERDRYGRLLAYVYRSDGVFANLDMVASGYAYEYTYGTPYRMQQEFVAAARTAREKQLGLWHPDTCNGSR